MPEPERQPGPKTRDALRARVEELESRLSSACGRAGRLRRDVTLVAVTKTVSPEMAKLAAELGLLDLGESRPQELWRKRDALPCGVRWHLVGHLQRNKVARTLPVSLIHSVDTLRLLTAIDEEAGRHRIRADVLLEVKLVPDPEKHGFSPDELGEALGRLAPFHHVRVRGLMTMASLSDDPEAARPTFRGLRDLAERHRSQISAPHELRELSMGMSDDFEVAVEEGATIVRLGSVLFTGLPDCFPG